MEFVVIGFDFAEGIVFLWNEVIELKVGVIN